MSNTVVTVFVIEMGPAGLLCALSDSLGWRSFFRLGTQYGNADGVQPRTLEIWDTYGILRRFVDGSAPVHAMVTYNPEVDNGHLKLVRTRPVRNVVVDSRFPYERAAAIEHIEGRLREALLEAGGTIQYSTTIEKEVVKCVGVLKHAVLYTILDNGKDKVQWTDVSRVLRSWKCVFISNQKSSPNVYELLGVPQRGAVIVVRPDDYVSMVQEIVKFNGDELTGFFLGL
ncbi:hypothetical protein PC9H_005889 [Pleurotus ostreatus]|uniref:Phenol hydroxylase-like C-terminal dimerisation domain-containing protein n=1 Tax=Pleurotus ostreatus TaxID=5322 RepID=A0A8H7DTL2_PLEOS|nr:uncharacterized protein PC9H_005889 [Pleurotus ostreatus]KAF7430189.1 hypothetical protein PC9H_005889 [Pleurotus ostreatus]